MSSLETDIEAEESSTMAMRWVLRAIGNRGSVISQVMRRTARSCIHRGMELVSRSKLRPVLASRWVFSNRNKVETGKDWALR